MSGSCLMTVPIDMPSSGGWNPWPPLPDIPSKRPKIMKMPAVLPKRVFGASVIIASVFSAGCAVPVINQPMATEDLDRFYVDCSRKEQQIAMLQAQRSSADDGFLSRFSNAVQPWGAFSKDPDYRLRQDIGRGMTNWQINQNLMRLRNCP
jgi:hypothetical protein